MNEVDKLISNLKSLLERFEQDEPPDKLPVDTMYKMMTPKERLIDSATREQLREICVLQLALIKRQHGLHTGLLDYIKELQQLDDGDEWKRGE